MAPPAVFRQKAWENTWDHPEARLVHGGLLLRRYWQPGQPNSYGGNQDCGEILQDSSGPGQWNDDACGAQQTWVCEK